MALQHAQPGELIAVQPYGHTLGAQRTHALFKSAQLEAIRIVLGAGKQYAGHAAPGDLTIQCIEGRVRYRDATRQAELTPATLLYVPAAQAYELHAEDDASLLMILRLA